MRIGMNNDKSERIVRRWRIEEHIRKWFIPYSLMILLPVLYYI